MVKGLFVGARVRILWSAGWPELAGNEGKIVGVPADGGLTGKSEWFVAPDCWGTYFAPTEGKGGGDRFGPSSDQLEPILPEGAQPLGYSFEQMMSEFEVAEAVK